MVEPLKMRAIARIHNDFPQKFGLPRQSGLVDELESIIVFEPEYRAREALRGIETYSHLWLVWLFSENLRAGWSPTVRPPRLGGNVRMGVFATRSPFRPNGIGLSCVRLKAIETRSELGSILRVSGGDLMDNTPILDIKPYVPYADCHPDAAGGFASLPPQKLEVTIPDGCLAAIPKEKRAALRGVLEQDPRPAYQASPERIYAFEFANLTIRFSVQDNMLCVHEVLPSVR